MTDTAQCPVNHDGPLDQRITHYPGEVDSPAIEERNGVWHVRSLEAAREVLRSRATTQAGFNSESVSMHGLRPPILFSDGTDHRLQRAAIARYFAPKTVDSKYMDLMTEFADKLVDEVRRDGSVDLSKLSLRYSVMVAAQVVGLTNSDLEGMSRRLEKFFATPALPPAVEGDAPRTMRSRFDALQMSVKGQLPMIAFHVKDVRPAIKARKKHREPDVISHLLDEGYKEPEIMIECVTYGAAGMVTTREYIGMATWHMLDDDALRARFLAAEKTERYQILHEILRLEPIVGHLYRRTTEDLTLTVEGVEHTIPSGSLVDLYVRSVNADPAVVGEAPLQICPGRELPPRVGDEVMSFGDGAHKCPGNSLAIQEADVLLTRLLKLPLKRDTKPVIQWDELIKGYEVRNIRLVVDPAASQV